MTMYIKVKKLFFVLFLSVISIVKTNEEVDPPAQIAVLVSQVIPRAKLLADELRLKLDTIIEDTTLIGSIDDRLTNLESKILEIETLLLNMQETISEINSGILGGGGLL